MIYSKKYIDDQRKQVSNIFKPKIVYDKNYDSLYISFRGLKKIRFSATATNGITFDLDKDLNIVGLEIGEVSEWVKKS